MGYGLFGKVPQKRDFMSMQMPSAVLSPFETWLQSGVAASRNALGPAWQDHYLVAPIWRFWIGRNILGTTVAGALMPSVDQVGRYFPLSIMYFAEDADSLPPPLLATLDHWYAGIEQRLLHALSEETDAYLPSILDGLERPFEQQDAPFAPPAPAPDLPTVEPADEGTIAPAAEDAPAEDGAEFRAERAPEDADETGSPRPAVEDLPDTSPFDDLPPEPAAIPAVDGGLPAFPFKGGQTIEVPPGLTLAEVSAELRVADYRHASEGRSYFWCAASRSGPGRIHAKQGLPDPYFFSRMILWDRGPQ